MTDSTSRRKLRWIILAIAVVASAGFAIWSSNSDPRHGIEFELLTVKPDGDDYVATFALNNRTSRDLQFSLVFTMNIADTDAISTFIANASINVVTPQSRAEINVPIQADLVEEQLIMSMSILRTTASQRLWNRLPQSIRSTDWGQRLDGHFEMRKRLQSDVFVPKEWLEKSSP